MTVDLGGATVQPYWDQQFETTSGVVDPSQEQAYADQLFEQILQRHETGGGPVLVHDDRQVEFLLLHLESNYFDIKILKFIAW